VSNAYCAPRPIPIPPIMVGGAGATVAFVIFYVMTATPPI
jgi:hypothetical protein